MCDATPLAARGRQEFKGGAEFDLRLCANCVHIRARSGDPNALLCASREEAKLDPVPVRAWDYCGQFQLAEWAGAFCPQVATTCAGGYLGAFPPLPASHKR